MSTEVKKKQKKDISAIINFKLNIKNKFPKKLRYLKKIVNEFFTISLFLGWHAQLK